MTVLKKVRTRLNEAGSCHFLDAKTGLLLEGSSCLGPSVEAPREVIISDVTGEEMYGSVKYYVHTHLSQTLGNQG